MATAKKTRPSRVPPRLPDSLGAADLPRDDVVDDALLRGLRFDSVDLSGRTARLVDVAGCHLVASNLAEGHLDKVTVVDSVVEGCDLANTELSRSALTRVELTGCRATGLRLPGVLMRHVLLRECLAEMSAFRFASLTNVWFVDCRLQRADFVSADLTSAVFRRCDLTGADLSQVKARGALFVDCVWDGVRGISDLAGATVVHGSPLDAHAFMVGMAGNLGILLGHPEDFASDE